VRKGSKKKLRLVSIPGNALSEKPSDTMGPGKGKRSREACHEKLNASKNVGLSKKLGGGGGTWRRGRPLIGEERYEYRPSSQPKRQAKRKKRVLGRKKSRGEKKEKRGPPSSSLLRKALKNDAIENKEKNIFQEKHPESFKGFQFSSDPSTQCPQGHPSRGKGGLVPNVMP